MYNILYMLFIEQKIIKKKEINKNIGRFEASNNKKYKVEIIWNSIVYIKELETSYLLELYYLVT